MKHRFIISLLASLLMGGEAVAQKVLLPYGQETKEAWDAKYYLAPIGGEEPPADWFEPTSPGPEGQQHGCARHIHNQRKEVSY